MDVNKISFYPLLIDIITDISKAHFVAIDLELSGVPSKASWGEGKPTLQQRYTEVKEAAEKYQILQIGLTCVEQDVANEKYILKPYNFDLSPVINQRGLDIERIFSFQSGAAEFLLGVGFDMNRPFSMGVPYLSREESVEARQKHAKRQTRGNIADIQIKPTETESLAFLDRVRKEINAWSSSQRMDTPNYVNILPTSVDGLEDSERELSRFEKRLVHQLVRAEFPELVTISRRAGIQIVPFDKEREDRIASERKRDLEERIARQKGFRWIIEAMNGSNITKLDLRESAKDPMTGEPIFVDLDHYKAQFHRASALLRGNPRVLVGHNCFLDMVYIYKTFIGSLPELVEDFQRQLHEIWPVIVDTKYMSTHNCGDINPVSSLEQIADQLKSLQTPAVKTDELHTKYDDVEAFHEAGYDSFLTAQIAVRLSAKLEREGAYVELDGKNGVGGKLADMALGQAPRVESEEKVIDKTNDRETSDSTKTTNGFTPSVAGQDWMHSGDDSLGPPDVNDPFYKDPKDRTLRHNIVPVTFPGGMPKFGSDFWRVYGNKLRVFGTQEGVCVLGNAADSSGVTSDEETGGVNVDI